LVATAVRFEITGTKTEWMVMGFGERRKLRLLKNTKVKECEEFEYLGVVQTTEVHSKAAITRRMQWNSMTTFQLG